MNSHRRIPFGLGGTNITVHEAQRLAVEGSRDPDIITLARSILLGWNVPERDHAAEVVAIHTWVKSHSRYTNDSVDAEVLTSIKGPQGLMAMYKEYGSFAGDCDDFVIFEAALLRSIGINTRFVTLSRANRDAMNRMQHIYLEADVDNEWVPLDPILKKRPAGYAAPQWTAKKVYKPLGAYDMHINSRVPVVGRFRRGARRVSTLVRPIKRRSPSFGLGAISLFKPLKATFTRMYGTEQEKATQREDNRINTAKGIFDKATAGQAVALTGPDSLQYAIQVYNDNHLPIPTLPAGLAAQAAAKGVSLTARSSAINPTMIVALGGGLLLLKLLKVF